MFLQCTQNQTPIPASQPAGGETTSAGRPQRTSSQLEHRLPAREPYGEGGSATRTKPHACGQVVGQCSLRPLVHVAAGNANAGKASATDVLVAGIRSQVTRGMHVHHAALLDERSFLFSKYGRRNKLWARRLHGMKDASQLRQSTSATWDVYKRRPLHVERKPTDSRSHFFQA